MDMPDPPNQTKPPTWLARLRHTLIGPPRDLRDPHIGHKMSLIALLAWVGLGADGLSSSAYGPEESYRALGSHTYLAIFLVLATAGTVFIISYAYSKIIEHFPAGGGGYLVATKLLGSSAGAVSGCALLVDYILTITVSIAGGGDAIFSLLPAAWLHYKLAVEYAAIIALLVLNLRGVKESVTALVPIFLIFILTHLLMIGGAILYHLGDVRGVASSVGTGMHTGLAQLGAWGLFVLFLRSYSMGAGTYTGIEAVSNGVAMLREPRVQTGKRTMLYMSVSLALTAGGLLLCYMLAQVKPTEGQTLNTVLAQSLAGSIRIAGIPVGKAFVFITIFSEAVLLLVAAQTGFLGGPRIMANMAMDNWLPRRFAALSDRLTEQNGILVMGIAAMATLAYTRGHITILVVMYSINVFVTFSLSQLGMSRFWISRRKTDPQWKRQLLVHVVGVVLCVSILVVMLVEKLGEGGWITLAVTSLTIALCTLIRAHYRDVGERVRDLDRTLGSLPQALPPKSSAPPFDPAKPTAAILVGGYGGMGIHILMTVMRLFPKTFQNVVFLTVGAVDSAFFREGENVTALEARTCEWLDRYVEIAGRMGLAARRNFRLGTDVVSEASALCAQTAQECGRVVFFSGSLAFDTPHWYDRLLHNETAYAIQREIKSTGQALVILPVLVPRKVQRPAR